MGVEAIQNAGLALQAGGAISSAVGSWQSGNTAITNFELQARSDQLNQKLSSLNAKRAELNAGSLLLNADAAEFGAWVAEQNAKMAERGGQFERQKGQWEVGQLTLKAGQLKGKQRASLAASGVDLGEGNAAEIQAGTDLMKEADVATITANALRAAWGYQQQKINYEVEGLNSQLTANNYRTAAGNARVEASAENLKASVFGINARVNQGAADSVSPAGMAASSLLTGGTRVAESWYRYRNQTDRGN